MKSFQDDLALTVAKEYIDNQGQRDTKTVSYTHLDVYKRQDLNAVANLKIDM